MREWIDNFVLDVKEHPKEYGKDIKNLCRLVVNLLEKKGIEYKKADPEAFCEMCKSITHKEGEWAGKPLELSLEQKFIVASVLGIKILHKRYGWVRFFRELNIFVARKWGKTLFIGALALWLLAFDKEPGSYGTVLAENAQQSKKLYDYVVRAAAAKAFKGVFKESKTEGVLRCPLNEGEFTYLSGRPRGKDGSNPNFFVIDEAHEIIHDNQYTSQTSGQGARRQPLGIVISTAGVTPDSLYEILLNRNRRILAKRKFDKNERIFPVIFTIDDNDDPKDKRCWIKANPGMREGRPSMEYLEGQLANSLNDARLYNQFLAKNVNRHIGANIDYFDFLKIKKAAVNIKAEDFIDAYAVGGVDLAETTDLVNATAQILKRGKFIYLQAYFLAAERLEINSQRDKVEYRMLSHCQSESEIIQQLLIITPGSYVQKEYVTSWFCKLRDDYQVSFLKIGYDRALSKEWLTDMQEHGFSHEKYSYDRDTHIEQRDDGVLTQVAQGGWTLSPAIKIVKSLFDDGKVSYDKTNILLPYCFYNLKIRIDANNNMAPQKAKSTGHIDGAIGIFNSFIAYERAKTIYSEYSALIDLFSI